MKHKDDDVPYRLRAESLVTKFSNSGELIQYAPGYVRIRVSAPVPDRDDEIVDPTTLRLDAYRLNPVVLYGHDQQMRFPVGKCESPGGEFKVWLDGVNLWAEFYFAGTAQAQEVADLYRQKVLRGASIGFKSDGLEAITPQEAERLYGVRRRLNRHIGGELLEISCVPVPCNPVALADRWVDPVLAANVVARGWAGAPSRPLSQLVRKSLIFSPSRSSGFPRRDSKSIISRGVRRMSKKAKTTEATDVETKTTETDTNKDASNSTTTTKPVEDNTTTKATDTAVKADAVNEEQHQEPDGDEEMDSSEMIKTGLMAAAGACLSEMFQGGDRKAGFAKLEEIFGDYDKWSGGDEETKETDSDSESEDESEESTEEDEKALFEMIRKAVREEVKPIRDELDGVTDVLDVLTSKR